MASVTRRRKTAKRWIRGPADELAIREGCYFDEDAGRRSVEFIETFCRQSKGRWAGQPLTLLAWQRDFQMRLFGWKRPDGLRRYKRAYLEIPKKNGKSTLFSSEGLELLIADGEPAPEVYLCAVDKDQAGIVYEEAARMVEASPELSARIGVLKSRKRLVDTANNGTLICASADTQKADGVNASAVIFDELHRQKNRQMWEVFEYAGSARDQPLTLSITTAGESESGVWYEQRKYSEDVNAGVIPDIAHLGVVYRADPHKDDLDDPRVWLKANPSMGHTIRQDDFAREFAEAKAIPEKLANFLRLRLGIITRGDKAFVDLDVWNRNCGAPEIPEGAEVYGGGDFSKVSDLTAFAWVARVDDAIHARVKFYLPEDNVVSLERKHQAPYRTWADQGFITLTPGNAVDYDFVRADINRLAGELRFAKILIDPWNAHQLCQDLAEKDGLPIEQIRQGFASLNAPTKELLRLLLMGRIRHGGHPILRWNAVNAIAVSDPAGNIKLDKEKSRQKIDGLSALVNAIAGLTTNTTSMISVYETKDLILL